MGRPPGSRNKTVAPEMENFDQEAQERGALTVIPPAPKSVITDMATRYGMEPPAFEAALRSTVVPKDVSLPQFAAFLLVAKEYNLNPLTKEIYAFPSRSGGIVPIVSVDGWVNLVNSHGTCDGFDFEMEHDDKNNLVSCTCRMYRKDRQHPVVVTEYLVECIRQTEPWKMKHRMLRHKAMIQAARYAFGFSGIYDEDEGQKIAEIVSGQDIAPPRQVIPQTEEARDGTPPPREKPKQDAPPRDAAPPRQAATKKADPITTGPQDKGPSAKPIEPFKIPGNDETFESWCEKYIDNIKTSPDTATAYKWIDVNREPLERLNKGRPSVYAKAKGAAERVMEQLRAATQKAADKAAKKAEKAQPTEMGDGPSDDMADGPAPNEYEESLSGKSGPPDEPPSDNPEEILQWIRTKLEAAASEDIDSVWENECQQYTVDMIPPDRTEAERVYNYVKGKKRG